MRIVNHDSMVEGNLYVTIKTIDIKNKNLIIPSDTMLKLDYIFKAFSDIVFRYINGKLVEQNLKYKDIDGVFRLPYTNELKLSDRSLL